MDKERQLLQSGFTADQIQEICEGIQKGLDISFYATKEYLSVQMRQIRLGLEENLSVEFYAKPFYDWFQMEEIRKGLKTGLDVKCYAKPDISYDKMRQIRKGLKNGFDLSPYKHLEAGILKELRKSLVSGVSIVRYITDGYNKEQLEAIRHALERGIDIDSYLDVNFRGSSIHEIAIGLEHGLDVSSYARTCFTWRKMREIRLGMEHRLDITQYADPLYSCWQMREIRLGLEARLDVTSYHSLMYTAKEMHKLRLQQEMESTKPICSAAPKTIQLENYNLLISEDEMEVYLEITGEDTGFNPESIVHTLHQFGISHGIDESAIYSIDHSTENCILIARGTPPISGQDGWYEYFFRTKLNRTPKQLPDGTVDFKSIEWFEIVKENQTVAVYHEPQEGTPGFTVTGRLLPAKRGKEKRILKGTGFHLLPDHKTYVASITGSIERNKKSLNISRLLILDELTVNNDPVDFNGNIYVSGNIGQGSHLRATGDIVVNGYVETSVIESGKNILFRQGVNASGTGQITARKNIVGKFFEAANLSAGQDIQTCSCMHCNIVSKGQIKGLGSKSCIIGGTAYAENGFHIHNAGNPAGVPTCLIMGMNHLLRTRLHQLDSKISEVTKELDTFSHIHTNYKIKYSPALRNTMKIYLKIEDAIYTKRAQLERLNNTKISLKKRIDAASHARAVVEDMVYENVVFEISGQIWHSKPAEHIIIGKSRNRITLTEIEDPKTDFI